MAYTLATSSSSALMWDYFNRRALEAVKPFLVFDQLGDRTPLPEKYGQTVIFTKFKRLDAVTSAGTDGTPPTPIAITSAQITASVSQYKNAIGYTDALVKMAANDGLEGIMEDVVYENVGNSVDQICRNALDTAVTGTGAILYGGGASALSDVDSADKLTLSLARQAKLMLESENVEPHSKGYYAFVAHPNTLYDMKTDTATGGWIDVFKYNDSGYKMLFDAESGQVDQIKFLATTNVSSTNSGTSGGAYAYTNMIFGKQPFGSVKLNSNSINLIHHKPGSSGTSDPVDELGTIGWKVWYSILYFGGNTTVDDPHRIIKLITGRAS